MADETGRNDEGRGDDVYQPEHSDVKNRPSGDLDLENVLDERGLDDMLDEGYSPPERPLVVGRHGTTGDELRRGESLDERLAQEMPDAGPPEGDGIGDLTRGAGEPVDDEAGAARAGRLTFADETAPPGRNDVVARDVGVDGGAASAEEAAMHVIEGIEGDMPSEQDSGAQDEGALENEEFGTAEQGQV